MRDLPGRGFLRRPATRTQREVTVSDRAPLAPTAAHLAGYQTVLVVGAHPDDADFGAGATTAAMTDLGVRVHYCVITDGDAGGFDPAVARSEIPAIRRQEQHDAAEVLGVSSVTFLGYRDGDLTVTSDLRRDISRVIRRLQPDLVISQNPERGWMSIYADHPDHLAAGEATMQAVYPDSRNPFAHPSLLADEGLDEWHVPEVWVLATRDPNRYVDVTETFDRKVAALKAHTSQTAHLDDLEAMLRSRLAERAAEFGLPTGTLVETFRSMDTR